MASLAQSQWALVLDIFFADGTDFVPEEEPSGDDYADPQADDEEPAIGGEPDQRDRHNGSRGDQCGCASNRNSHTTATP